MGFKHKWPTISLVSIGICLCLPLNLLADGKFIFTPKIAAAWRVDSNYFRSDDDERDAYTYLIEPGVEVGYETSKSLVSLDYVLQAFFFDDRDSDPPGPGRRRAGEDDYVGHQAKFQARTRPTTRLLLGLDNTFFLTRDSAQTDSLGNFTDRDKYWKNRFSPRIYYEFHPRFATGVRYRYEKLNWTEGDNDDSDEHRGIFDLIYNFSRTSHLDLEYQHWQRDFDGDESDYTSNQLRLIFRKQFKNISFEAGGGYQDRSFDDSDESDISTPAYMLAITGQWPPAPDKARTHFSLMFDQNFNDVGLGSGYYVARRVTLRAGRVFWEKIVTDLEGYYQNSDYETDQGFTSSGRLRDRDDDIYHVEGRVGYRMYDWMTFSIGGGYQERDSNLVGLDYENTFFWTRIDLKF